MFSKAKTKDQKPKPVPSLLAAEITVTGDVTTAGDVQIDGTLDGDVRCAALYLGTEGRVRGHVEAETVLIRGAVDGNITASEVTLTRTARVRGDIRHETITIEPGAQFAGHCENLNAAARTQETRFNVVVNDGVAVEGSKRR